MRGCGKPLQWRGACWAQRERPSVQPWLLTYAVLQWALGRFAHSERSGAEPRPPERLACRLRVSPLGTGRPAAWSGSSPTRRPRCSVCPRSSWHLLTRAETEVTLMWISGSAVGAETGALRGRQRTVQWTHWTAGDEPDKPRAPRPASTRMSETGRGCGARRSGNLQAPPVGTRYSFICPCSTCGSFLFKCFFGLRKRGREGEGERDQREKETLPIRCLLDAPRGD